MTSMYSRSPCAKQSRRRPRTLSVSSLIDWRPFASPVTHDIPDSSMYSCGERGSNGSGALPTTIMSLNILFAAKPQGFNSRSPTFSSGLQMPSPGICERVVLSLFCADIVKESCVFDTRRQIVMLQGLWLLRLLAHGASHAGTSIGCLFFLYTSVDVSAYRRHSWGVLRRDMLRDSMNSFPLGLSFNFGVFLS